MTVNSFEVEHIDGVLSEVLIDATRVGDWFRGLDCHRFPLPMFIQVIMQRRTLHVSLVGLNTKRRGQRHLREAVGDEVACFPETLVCKSVNHQPCFKLAAILERCNPPHLHRSRRRDPSLAAMVPRQQSNSTTC